MRSMRFAICHEQVGDSVCCLTYFLPLASGVSVVSPFRTPALVPYDPRRHTSLSIGSAKGVKSVCFI